MADGVDQVADVLLALIRSQQAPMLARLAALEARSSPTPERGETGPPGPEGPAGRDGRDGLPGLTGDRGLDGTHGRNGIDALGFDDIRVEHDGERRFTFLFVRGDVVKPFGTFTVPLMIYREVYDQSRAYEPGDVVTFAGSTWIAKAETKGIKPDEGHMSGKQQWQLCVKRGAIGPKGAQGDKGTDGHHGKDGRDLTQVGPDGARW